MKTLFSHTVHALFCETATGLSCPYSPEPGLTQREEMTYTPRKDNL